MSNTPKKKLKRKRRMAGAQRGVTSLNARDTAVAPSVLPARRAMEGVLAKFVGGFSKREGTPVQRAQEVMYQAWEARNRATSVALARKALAISADCADAYLLLAEESQDPIEIRRLLEEALAAGERALGKKFFKEHSGHFWGLLETRPYMRARAELAGVLWRLGELDAAIDHYREILKLNPNDNQGVRQVLVGILIEAGRDSECGEILARYEDDASAWMVYARALLAFRRDGACDEALKVLREAIDANAHVPAYLLGRKKLPRTLPDYHGFGDESEALLYANDGIKTWRITPGALAWLTSSVV